MGDLPQFDDARGTASRVAGLAAAQKQYQYDYGIVPQLPLIDLKAGHPPGQTLTSIDMWPWLYQTLSHGLALVENLLAVLDKSANATTRATAAKLRLELGGLTTGSLSEIATAGVAGSIWKKIQALVEKALEVFLEEKGLFGTATSMQDYLDLFQTMPLPACTKYFRTGVSQATQDAYFAREPVQGNNPVVLERVKAGELTGTLPITDAQYQGVMGAGDDLATAISDGRLYWCNYRELAGLKDGTYPQAKFAYAPIALYAVPKAGADRALVAVCVQCAQTPGPAAPLIFPSDPAWPLARTIVRAANQMHHVELSHVPRTHVVMEAICIATWNTLSTRHPLHRLLVPHTIGTLAFDSQATGAMMDMKTGWFRVLLGSTHPTTMTTMNDAYFQRSFTDYALPNDLKNRGVDDTTALPYYPYRDDGLLLWNATYAWVQRYVQHYYQSAKDVQDDTELQAWVAMLTAPAKAADQGAQLKDFGDGKGQIQDVATLVDTITTIVWLATGGHAAIHYVLTNQGVFAPAAPMAGYAPGPIDPKTPADELTGLPPLQWAAYQLAINSFGSIRINRMGHYGFLHFHDLPINLALWDYQQALEAAETTIAQRNQSRPDPYPILLPSQVPLSIHI